MTRITFSNNIFITYYPYYLLPFSQCCLFLSFSSVMLKRSVFTPILNKGNAEECSNYHKIALISHASKVMLKILQPRLQQYMKQELLDVQAELKKGRGKIANIHWIIEKAREFQKKKKIYFCFIDYAKTFDSVDHNKLWKILQEMAMPDHFTCLLRNLYAGEEATVRI